MVFAVQDRSCGFVASECFAGTTGIGDGLEAVRAQAA